MSKFVNVKRTPKDNRNVAFTNSLKTETIVSKVQIATS